MLILRQIEGMKTVDVIEFDNNSFRTDSLENTYFNVTATFWKRNIYQKLIKSFNYITATVNIFPRKKF